MATIKNSRKLRRLTLLARVAGSVFFYILALPNAVSQRYNSDQIDSLISLAVEIGYQNFEKSESLYSLVIDEITSKGNDGNMPALLRTLHERASTNLYHGKVKVAKDLIEEAKHLTDRNGKLFPGGLDSLRAETQVREANYFYAVGRYQEALTNLNDAESFFKIAEPNTDRCVILYSILQFQASIYQLEGEFESAIDRYKASIQYYDCYRQESTFPNYILVNRNIAVAYLKMKNIYEAKRHLKIAKANLDSCPVDVRDFTILNHATILYNSISELYLMEDNTDSAEFYLKQLFPNLQSNSLFESHVIEGLGKVAIQRNDIQTAQKLFDKALAKRIAVRGEKHYMTANLYQSLALLALRINQNQVALDYMQKALNSLSSVTLSIQNHLENPPLNSLSSQNHVIFTLHEKAKMLQVIFNRTNNLDYLTAAQATAQLAIAFIERSRKQFNLDKDRVILAEDAIKVYETSIYVTTHLFHKTGEHDYLNECFKLIDECKSAVLIDQVKHIKRFSDLPPSLLEKEHQLKVELSIAEQNLYQAELKKLDTGREREQFGEIKKAFAALLNDIKVTAPNYYKLRIENKTLTLTEAQSILQPNELLVEYFLSDSMLYTMTVTSTTAELHTTAIDSLRSQVETLRNMLARPGNLADANYQGKWNSICKAVFKKVVAPWQKHLKSSKRIIVVPHDVLNYLPLEMLSDPGTPLINSVSISYASSAALLREQKQMTPTGNFFAAFDADYSNQPHLPQLAGASREVSSIENIFGFRSTRFAAATADDFRKQAANFKIIHLALHSLINDEKPMFSRLVFTRTADDNTNDDITANELYSMQLNAEIAVLSACETGLGKLQRGEGMMSLSRAFMYAGVPSTVISLWKVPDQSASILMTKFYQFLKEGHRKDEALQLAKLEFIKEHPEMSHPFFWAGFIVNGKTDPLSFAYFSTQEIFAIAILSLCLALASTMFILKRRKGAKPISVTH